MKNTDNIEKLFKETFEHFEADVNPQVWSTIQNGINPVSGGVASSAAKFAIGKIIAGAASVGLIAGSLWYFSSSPLKDGVSPFWRTDNKTNSSSSDTQRQAESYSNPQNIISENKSANDPSNTQTEKQITYAVHSFNKNSSAHSQQTQIVSDKVNNADIDGASVSENTANISTPTEQHKYGKSSAGPTSLIRGNKRQNPQLTLSKNNSSSINQNAEQNPDATIWASAESGDAPLTVNFSAMGATSALTWDFGDGTTSRENSPSHTFKTPGSYAVKLVAKNWSGNNTSDKITIEVKAISGIVNTPNIFSPNGDGENDFFFFELKNIVSSEVVISDLNGGLIHKWNNRDGNWDGKLMNGEDAPEGVYFYAIQAIGADGVIHSPKGTVTLSRKSER